MNLLKKLCLSLFMFLAIADARASDDESNEEVAHVTQSAQADSQNGMILGNVTNPLLPLIFSKTTTNAEGQVEPILSIQDLCRSARVCKNWNRLSSLDVIWKPYTTRVYKFDTIGIETYNLSQNFLRLMSLANPQKLLLANQISIQEELSIIGGNLFEQNKCSMHLMIALELLGDTSLISTYLSEARNESAIENIAGLIKIIDSCIAQGSHYAAQFKTDNQELLSDLVN